MPQAVKHMETVILERRMRATQMYLQGKAQWEIAAELKVSANTVSLDIAAVEKMWLASTLRDFDAAKAEQLAKIDNLERRAWEAWWRSCEAAETVKTSTERAPKVTPTPAKQVGRGKIVEHANNGLPSDDEMTVVRENVERVMKGQSGNPAFLSQIQWCIETRLKVLGAFAEDNKSKAPQVTVIDWGGMTERTDAVDPAEQRIAQIRQLTAPTPQPVDSSPPEDAEVVTKSPGKKEKRK